VGGLSLIFQSGLYEPRLDFLFNRFNLHLGKLIDLGNKMDIQEVEALEYLVADPDTRVIGVHLESVEGGGREFLRLIREATRHKHVVVLKSGRTEAGARAAASHTGVMVQGDDRLFDCALRQVGAVRAQGIEEFFDLCAALERFGDLGMKGNRVALATLPGGRGDRDGSLPDSRAPDGLRERGDARKDASCLPAWDIGANPSTSACASSLVIPGGCTISIWRPCSRIRTWMPWRSCCRVFFQGCPWSSSSHSGEPGMRGSRWRCGSLDCTPESIRPWSGWRISKCPSSRPLSVPSEPWQRFAVPVPSRTQIERLPH